MRITALLLLALTALTSGVSYHGYQVVSVTPHTTAQAQVLQEAVQQLQLQQWTEPHGLGVPVDVMVPPSLVEVFLSGLQAKHIPVQVKITDVQAIIDEQAAKRPVRKSLPRTFDHNNYNSLEEIESILEGVEEEFPSLVTISSAGTTYEGREILVAQVSSDGGETRPVIWIDCGIHAREWISPAVCQYILDELTSGYGTKSEITELLDTYDFHIIPVVNPDGYEYSWNSDRLWRKNRVPHEGVVECHGVDVNRNFEVAFGEPGASDEPCSELYQGPEAFSEEESKAVRDGIEALGSRVTVFYSLHSYSQHWMTPYGYTDALPDDYDEMIRVVEAGVEALEAVFGTPYTYGSVANTMYVTSGASYDWAYEIANIPYVNTIQLRDDGTWGFLLPEEEILPTAEETFAGIVAAAAAI